MFHKKLLWIWSVTLVLVCSLNARAEPEKPAADFQPYDLATIVVTEAREKDRNIAITNEITAEDIKATNSHTVAEALSHAPGIKVSTGAKNQASVSIHGFDQDSVLFMIDGVPFYETKFGILDLNTISTDNIARIEIIKSAASVLYGANSMGGVVNIITKKSAGDPSSTASFEFSENDSYRGSISHGAQKGILNYWMNYLYEKSSGWDLSDDFNPKTGKLTDRHTTPVTTKNVIFEDGDMRDNSDYERQNIWVKLGVEPEKDSEYYVNFHFLKMEKGVPSNTVSNNVFSRPVFSQFYADRIPDYDQWGIDLDARQALTGNLTAKAKLFYHDHKDSLYSYEDPSFLTILAKSHYRDYTAGTSVILDYQPVSWNAVRLAVNYKGDSHKEVADEYLPYEKYFSYTGSVGLEDEMSFIDNLSVILGASYDWFEVTEAQKNTTASNGDFISQDELYQPDDDQFNGMIGANYLFSDKTKLFASIARKSRFPSLNDLYNVIRNGDPHLSSEKSINYSAGVSRPFGAFFKADASFFCYDIKDMITSVGSGVNKKLVNIGKVMKIGYEVGMEMYPVEKLVLRVDYTYNHAEDKSDERTSDKVPGVAKDIANMSIQYTLPLTGTRIDMNGAYIGSVFNTVSPTEDKRSGYFLCNAKISQTILKDYEIYVMANNILDEDYEWSSGYPGQGRNLWAGMSMRF